MPKDTLKPAVDDSGEWKPSGDASVHHEHINEGLPKIVPEFGTRRLTQTELDHLQKYCDVSQGKAVPGTYKFRFDLEQLACMLTEIREHREKGD